MVFKQLKKLMISLSLATSLTLVGCASTTQMGAVGVNRQQLLLVSSEQVMQMASQSYVQTVQQAQRKGLLDTNAAQVQRLKNIANRLIPQVNAFRADARAWRWEVHTIKSNDLNAYVMPGGKIMFYTGIIDKLNLTDAEIAAIMGHEMAHALREHARERMSQQVATQAGLGIAANLLGLNQGQAQMAVIASDLGISKPNSRTQEAEADVVGLELMARAGYDPRAAIGLWQKMQQASKGEPPQFLSTHPSSGNRIAQIQRLLPRVLPLYTGQR